MKTVLEIQISAPRDDVGEEVAIEGGVLLQQCLEIQRPLGGDELVESDLVRRDSSPLLLDIPVVRVRSLVTDPLENHCVTLVEVLTRLPNRHRYDLEHEGRRLSRCGRRGHESATSRSFVTPEGLHS